MAELKSLEVDGLSRAASVMAMQVLFFTRVHPKANLQSDLLGPTM